MEQNTAIGINLINSVVIFRNSSLQALKKSLIVFPCEPIIPDAIPQITARKIS